MRVQFSLCRSLVSCRGVISSSLRVGKWACLTTVTCLCSCTVLQNPPERPPAKQITDSLSYKEGYAYLVNARTRLQDDVVALEKQDATTKGMVAGGVGGAGIAALFKGSSDLVLSLLTVGGIGYATNQNMQPLTRIAIYRAGLENLQCIDDAAAAVNRRNRRLKSARDLLKSEIDRVQEAANEGRRDGTKGPAFATAIDNAEIAVRSALNLREQIDAAVTSDDSELGHNVYSAVAFTLESVSKQLDSTSPNIDAIAQSVAIGSLLPSKRDAQAQGKSAATAAENALAGVERKSQGVFPSWYMEMQSIQKLLSASTASTLAVGSCKRIQPGAAPMEIRLNATPVDSVSIHPGDTFNFEVANDGNRSPVTGWWGTEPTITQLTAEWHRSNLKVSAPTTATPNSFTVYLVDASSLGGTPQRSNAVRIDIVPKPAPVKAASGTTQRKRTKAQAGGVAGIPDPPPVNTGAALPGSVKLTELGLAPDIKPGSPDYVARVKKLENCAGLALTGRMSDELQAYLATTKPIDAQGTCKPRSPAATPPALGSAKPATPNAVSAASPPPGGASANATPTKH